MPDTFDVRVWGIRTYQRTNSRTYGVRWLTAGEEHHETFTTYPLADGFRSKLVIATRQGESFDIETGLPASLARQTDLTWYAHTLSYVDTKWPRAAPKSRQSIADALAAVTLALLPTGRGRPEPKVLRAALYGWALNTTRRVAGPPDREDVVHAVKWIERSSPKLVALAERTVVRKVLDSLTLKMDGKPAAATTVARRRAVFYNALEHAVEVDLLPANPLDRVKWTAPKVEEEVDVRTVVNHDQARALLAAVERQSMTGRRLVAFFGSMYYSALRPGEATELHEADLVFSDEDAAAGELRLCESNPAVALAWTDDGSRQPRQLKHRSRKAVRVVPMPPDLARLLRRHLDEFGTGPDGRLFHGQRSPGPIPDSVYGRVWESARLAALTPEEAASPLGATPYSLRHAAVSTWLNAGVDPAVIAEWAGHSVAVLLRVYAKCVTGRHAVSRQRVIRHLARGDE
jgi:integrase